MKLRISNVHTVAAVGGIYSGLTTKATRTVLKVHPSTGQRDSQPVRLGVWRREFNYEKGLRAVMPYGNSSLGILPQKDPDLLWFYRPDRLWVTQGSISASKRLRIKP